MEHLPPESARVRPRRARRLALSIFGPSAVVLALIAGLFAGPTVRQAEASSVPWTGSMLLKPMHNDSMCLRTNGSGDENYTEITQRPCDSSQIDQLWTLIPQNDGTVKIQRRHATKCIGVEDGQRAGRGSKVWQWTCKDGNPAQKWILKTSVINGKAVVQIENAAVRGQCWDMKGRSKETWAWIQLYPCKSGTTYNDRNQWFHYTTSSGPFCNYDIRRPQTERHDNGEHWVARGVVYMSGDCGEGYAWQVATCQAFQYSNGNFSEYNCTWPRSVTYGPNPHSGTQVGPNVKVACFLGAKRIVTVLQVNEGQLQYGEPITLCHGPPTLTP